MSHKLKTSGKFNKNQLLIFCILFTIVGSFIFLQSKAAGPSWRTNYGSISAGTDNYSLWYEQVKASSRITYVNDPLGGRGTVQKVEVLPGDSDVAGSGSGERAEVMQCSNTPLCGWTEGVTYVMSWSTYIDGTFASPSGGWNNFVQTHASGGGNQSPWQLNLVGDTAELRMRVYGGGEWTNSGQPAGSTQEWINAGFLQKNVWHNFVAEIRYGCNGTGSTRLWVDNSKLIDIQNKKIGYCNDPGVYWKQGFYRAAYSKTTRLWFDDTLRWSNTSDAFAHYGWSGGTTPPPPPVNPPPPVTPPPPTTVTASSSVKDGNVLTGTVPWTITTSSPANSADYYIDNVKIGSVVKPNSTSFTYNLDTTKYPNTKSGGFWVLDANGGLLFRSPSIAFTVSNTSKLGDLNNDNKVDILDLSILLTNYSTNNVSADLNKDGAVNIFDLSILLSKYGT